MWSIINKPGESRIERAAACADFLDGELLTYLEVEVNTMTVRPGKGLQSQMQCID